MRRLSVLWLGLTAAFVAVFALDRALPPPIAGVAVSRVVTDSQGLPLRIFPVEDGRWRIAADLDSIDPRFIEALLLVEDRRFFEHRGVDLRAVLRAMRDNALRGQVVSGASTITMQTARLLEPRPRTLPSKIIEMIRARQIERRLSKEEILELYLTLAPYGGNLEGIRTASRAYFDHDPDRLTDGETALLIALPQSPEARRPDLRPAAARSARQSVLERLRDEDWIDDGRFEEAALDPLPRRRFAFPEEAWHFAGGVASAPDRRGTIRTTIDRQAQAAATAIARRAAEEAGPEVQTAVLVVRLRDRAVLASVGSAFRHREGGWLDLTRRHRSPGSTLKPLVYALAMQEGIVAPGTRVADLPTRFGAYAPQNFGGGFNGELTVAGALQHSLNVPAVILLDLVGPERMIGALQAAGLSVTLPDTEDRGAGLAVVLGGLGVTARDLATLYAAIGDGGMFKPLAETPDEARANLSAHGLRLLTAEASREVGAILAAAPSLAGRMPADLSASAPRIAFKTGTSYGYRDAWAAGFSDHHAVIVWIGRPDGAPRPGTTGREAALPVLFEVFDAVEKPIVLAGAPSAVPATPEPLKALQPDAAPKIVFPPDGSILWPKPDGAAFVLSARGDGDLDWYADGLSLGRDRSGNVLWRPQGPGFYRLTVSDRLGRQAEARVRIAASGS